MAKTVNPIPPGFHTIVPHLTVNGAARFMDFLKKAFGAEELSRSAIPDGRLMHVLARIGDSMLMFNDDFPERCGAPIAEGRWPMALNLCVPDADATWAQAVAAGCQETFPLADQFWGDRYGQVKDPFGFTWAISTRKEELTPEEIMTRQKALFGGAQGAA